MKLSRRGKNWIAAALIAGATLAGALEPRGMQARGADGNPPANGERPEGRPPGGPDRDRREPREGPANGERRREGPPGVEGAVERLKLTDEQKSKVDPLVREFRQKERALREDFLKQMKEVLTAEQFEKLQASMSRPPGPPPQGNREQGDRKSVEQPPKQPGASAKPGTSQAAVTFTGGYETDPRDHGRPVVLIAAALKVPTDVFRKAFSGVTPAAGGQEPEPGQVRKNKQALLQVLGPYGIANDQLDTASNYYRYSGSKGEMWRSTPATATATVKNGVITGFTVTNPGSGYSSPPTVSVEGIDNVNAIVKLHFGPDVRTNGSIQEITLAGKQ